ncbi:MAG: DUF2946 family protein [Janthinobacterium lividum]
MDQIVRDALAKWPNVPACTGWLLLDRRGQWRMRDDACQAAGDLGDVIHHAALKRFIERNYEADATGRWFFQNGPQRVFVDLAYTPHVVRLHCDEADDGGASRLVDECGNAFEPAAAWFDDQGSVLFSTAGGAAAGTPEAGTPEAGTPEAGTPEAGMPEAGMPRPAIALLHDHDLALFAERLAADATPEAIAGIPPGATPGAIPWGAGRSLPFAPIGAADVAGRFGFVPRPEI